MEKFPVLVTGGAGYVGSHAVLALRDRGWPVAVIDDLSNGCRSVVPDGTPFYEGSIADSGLVERAFEEQGIRGLMHFAGSMVVPESVEKPLDYYANNTVATHALVSQAVQSGVRHILFSSTSAVYGVPDRIPISESDPKNPINPYGASKLMTERMLLDSASAFPFNFGALRYFNVSGADPALRAGQIGKSSTQLIKIAVEAATGKRDHVDVCGTDYPTADGTCIRDYIHVSDLADAHVLALEKLVEEPDRNFVMNCGYGTGLSVIEVLDAVDRVTGKTLRRENAERRPGDPPELVASNALLLDTLDWKPQFDCIDTMVDHALAWEKKLQSGIGC